MASHVLMFPADSRSPRCSRLYATPSAPAPSALTQEAAAPAPVVPETTGRHSLQLVFSRPKLQKSDLAEARTQAQHIDAQVDRELAGRVAREAAERRTQYRMPSLDQRRALAAGRPTQATEVGLRHRLLDALLSFGRPA